MIDFIKYLVHDVDFTEGAVERTALPDSWKRARYDGDRPATDTIIFRFEVDAYCPVKALGHLTKDGRPRLSKVEAVLPSLLHGHNGRPIQNRIELALAITRLHFLLRFLVCERGHGRIVPGLCAGSLTYLSYVETSVQVQDPQHDLLVASHVARLKHQRFPSAVYWGESTRMSTRELAVKFYDKAAKVKLGFAIPEGMAQTRVEGIYKDADRLSGETRNILGLPKLYEPPPLVTLSPEVAYGLLRQALGRVTGFGWGGDIGTLQTIRNPKARLIAAMLGEAVSDPYRLESALRLYDQMERPGVRTFAEVEKELRAFAFNYIVPQANDLLPDDASDLRWSEVRWKRREDAWATVMRELGVPDEPDPNILNAWSETRFLESKPQPGELVGPVLPSRPPFRRNTF